MDEFGQNGCTGIQVLCVCVDACMCLHMYVHPQCVCVASLLVPPSPAGSHLMPLEDDVPYDVKDENLEPEKNH